MRNKILQLYAVSIGLGIIVGLVGSCFRLAIDLLVHGLDVLLAHIRYQGGPAALVSGFVSMIMVVAAYLAVKYIAPEAGGSGVPEIEGALLHQRPVYWQRLLPVKFFFGIIALAAKTLLGREGPTIHIGGSLGEMLGAVFNLNRHRRDSLIAAGAASGLAVAFNAPLAGVLFVMEEMRNEFNYSFTSFSMVAIACVVATVILELLIGAQPTIIMNVFELPPLSSLWLFVLFGFVIGLVGLLFNRALMVCLESVDCFTSIQKIYYVSVVGFAVGCLAVIWPEAAGGGMDIIHQALTMLPGFGMLCLLLLARFVGTVLCYGTGIPGGIFAPLLALGTLVGLAIYQILVVFHLEFLTQPGMFAVAGMAALFAAVTRSPITGAVLVVEMTKNYSLIFPLMMACTSATIVLQLARNEPIYGQLLQRTMRKNLNSI